MFIFIKHIYKLPVQKRAWLYLTNRVQHCFNFINSWFQFRDFWRMKKVTKHLPTPSKLSTVRMIFLSVSFSTTKIFLTVGG